MFLRDILREIDCSNDTPFSDSNMLILFCPKNKRFYRISFGDGSDDDPIEKTDTYVYIAIDEYDDDGQFQEDFDGGNMWFDSKDYNGKINDEKLIFDVLDFVNCPDPDNCILIKKI